MTSDRRIHSRIRTRIPARVRHGAECVEGFIENLGQGGAFFATDVLEVRIDDGADADVEFEVRRSGAAEPVRRHGTVLRSERYFDGENVVRAFAIRFDAELDLAGLEV
jgi:hypothetical protein